MSFSSMQRMASSETAVDSVPATERLLHRKMVRQTVVCVSLPGGTGTVNGMHLVTRRWCAGGGVESIASLCPGYSGGKVSSPELACIF